MTGTKGCPKLPEPLHIVWFKRDLRVDDHRPLAQAAANGPVLPLYVVEPDYWALPDTSERQYLFVRESLQELSTQLGALGQPLVIRSADVVELLDRLRRKRGVAALYSHQETGNGWTYARDLRLLDWCKQHQVPWHEHRQDGVIRRLKSRNGWANEWDRYMGEAVTQPPAGLAPIDGIETGDIPTPGDLGLKPDNCTARQPGGREAGLSLLYSFLHERGEPYQRAMSSPVSAASACSRLSPHLAHGTLSVREVAQALWARQKELKEWPPREANKWRRALSSFSGRLHWRCHFMQKLEDEPPIEFKSMHSAYDGLRDAADGNPLFEAWAAGMTGLPFLDACMRSLIATGWINFRMRAMMMAVASYHLWLDWRRTGEHLARQFTDYEPGIHWSQVQMQSGTTGINAVRVYNPVKQGYTQDPEGQFIRQWVPELAAVPSEFVHEPWTWGQFDAECGGYPRPVVDHEQAARQAKERIFAVRRSKGHKDVARTVVAKHGSRKSGIRQHMSSRTRRTSKKPDNQLSLFD